MSNFHCVKWGILGVRTVHGFESDWGDLEEDRLIGKSLQRGSVYFRVEASGSQHRLRFL